MHHLRFALDIGGTFTDIVVLDTETGRLFTWKGLNTPRDLAQGVIAGLRSVLAENGLRPSDVREGVHGTTLATNAVIERKGARTALVTTRGFRDILQIGREWRYDSYDLQIDLPEPLVPRHLRLEAGERVDCEGRVLKPVQEAEVRDLARRLRDEKVESLAVCLLHSYQFDGHERAVGRWLRAELPGIDLSLSCEVVPEIREYERTSTTVINAYVKPLVRRYLDSLEVGFRGMALDMPFYIMLSNGGTTTVEAAREFPVWLIESGPVAGVLAASFYGRLVAKPAVLAFDMGGTTAKMSLVDDYEPHVGLEFEVARLERLKKRSGFPIKLPSVELMEIGAGGGSIAHVDDLGLLKVGPQSAGAEPGPACYGLGGRQPTVTDADLLLGYIDPHRFSGGAIRLDVTAAERAMAEVGHAIGRDPAGVAAGIYEVVNENMAGAANIHIVERGQDPQKYCLVATGGAGPVHAYELARRLGIPSIVVPLGAGIGSAVGMLVAPKSFDFTHTQISTIDEVDWDRLHAALEALERRGRALVAAGDTAAGLRVVRSADMRYAGQGFEINVPLPDGRLGLAHISTIRQRFEERYRTIYEHAYSQDVPVEMVNWRLKVVTAAPRVDLQSVAAGPEDAASSGGAPAQRGERPAYFPEWAEFRPTPVYDHYHLAPGVHLTGPALVEQRETTCVVGPSGAIRVDPYLNLIVDLRW